ncbi:RNA methyltransferase, TrmH family, group 3 [Pseudopedobacter saltans DSM 12145]|uniref:RNA methyltransferase, TrmH family, group 3 n=1 Tax=Pseudopedobacter saltans (strain ATCC 51119 / DSM 12145 / JCM 21818 / CCUG 39354 / LMG 10337 / NBRC 100064 / NCIMB 13643) TaxID=762903 RepID=F0S952_PSESL|nr:23S rRNA (guanosine(2251)-2'-O)-methyltransferase RlmB [Pseudopedobacter saltans]ADY51350.1 RNA methyltransferase, TrmH family, group 3 [Pseudopedobacter saltans DSM 12145]
MQDRNFKRQEPRESNQMIFGIRAVIEAIKAGKDIESLFIQRGLTGGIYTELKTLLREFDIPSQQVPVEKLNRITAKNHQGVIAFISPITYQKIEDIIPQVYEKGETPLILILDNITDVRNFGAIARTAECSGVHAIVIPKRGAAQINPDAVKTSAGALYKVPVCRHDSLLQILRFLKDSGLQIVSCTEKTDDLIYKPDYTVPTAVIMGAEDTGISFELIRNSDYLTKIPMAGEIESLNVSVSAGIILYEAVRQRL